LVAFVRTIGAVCEPSCGSANLFVIRADGSDERQVTAYLPGIYPPIPIDSPAWSPNGRQLAFFRDGAGGHLELIRVDGTGLRTLAKHSFAPASWAGNGDRLAFGQLRGNLAQEPGRWRLTVQPLRGRARRFPLESPSSPVLAGPYWSRGGKALVFASVSTDTDFELLSAGPRGGGLRRLTHDRMDEFEPAWSPDGKTIAFVRGKIDRDQLRILRGSLYVMDADGRHARRLTRGSLDIGPAWAPSGKRIVFVRDHGLSVLDLAHGRIGSLGVGTDSEPAWSPDGRLIAFGAGTKLETVRPNGTEERMLFDGGDNGVPAQIGRPSWSPTDSRSR
jgi:Tol biopolymer transport system component